MKESKEAGVSVGASEHLRDVVDRLSLAPFEWSKLNAIDRVAPHCIATLKLARMFVKHQSPQCGWEVRSN